MKNQQGKGYGFFVVILLIVFLALTFSNYLEKEKAETYTTNEFLNDIENDKVYKIDMYMNQEVPTGRARVTFTDQTVKDINVADIKKIEETALESDVLLVTHPIVKANVFLTSILPSLIMLGGVLLVITFFARQSAGGGGGGGGKVMDFGKSRAKLLDERDKKKTFDDVAGLEEEKNDLFEIVDFLKNPTKYSALGAKIPKGVLLVGGPGTGKTLISKAVAGEAGVPFFSMSGSDFVEMFVGVGASRVRDLFEEAKKNAPCIVFIDEIDAVARRRGTGMGGGHDEREQTLNQLLVEMDGFGDNEGIIVLAATNRVDILDPAILRPGRFDRRVNVGAPDVKGREEILKVHAKNKPLGDDVVLGRIAQTTAGFTGADLANLLNESAIGAAREERKFIIQSDIDAAFIKVGIGTEKKSKVISDKDKRITAYHESGHAILLYLLSELDPLYTISIIPTGSAAGYVMPLPNKDDMFITKGKMEQEIIMTLGGRAAEEIIFDDITTGASHDIKMATNKARAMITKFGFSKEIGMINYENGDDEVFIGRDLAHTRSYSESTANKIDEEVKRMIDHSYSEAKKMLSENIEVVHRCANLLIEKERINRDEFEKLFEITI